jgi:hypothetical protein
LESYHSINWFSNATPNLKAFASSQTSKQIAEFLKNTYGSAPACHESCDRPACGRFAHDS